MRPIVSSEQMRKIEERAIGSGISQEMLMEEAGLKLALHIAKYTLSNHISQKILVLAGKGNNGGDAYVASRHLLQRGFSVVVWQLFKVEKKSLLEKQKARFEALGGIVETPGHTVLEKPDAGLIIDGIFGSGFHGVLDLQMVSFIKSVNSWKLPIIAIDIPSGLDSSTGENSEHAIMATCTLTLEFPKVGFFLRNGWNTVGKLVCLPIGLLDFSQNIDASFSLLEEDDVKKLVPAIVRNRHKYSRGHVVAVAGSHGMVGASLMGSWAALRAGAGIVHLLYNQTQFAEVSGPPWEIVRLPYKEGDFHTVKQWINKATSCFIGPGLGSSKEAESLLEALWQNFKDKSIIDADALNWLSRQEKSFGPVPKSILTPHIGEMQRLLQSQTKEPITIEFLNKVQAFVEENQANLVLKGAPTFLFSYDKKPIVMPRGDPGMATAGSGDVLTGILAALLAQNLMPSDAMQLGTYLHAMAGEVAAKEETSYAMTASSIIQFIPRAWKALITYNHK